MASRRAVRAALALLLPLAVAAGWAVHGAAQETMHLQCESFGRDPGWEGLRNRLLPQALPRVTQAFGFSRTAFAGAAGEIGGQVWRSTTPAYYAQPIARRTLDDRLAASGSFALTKSSGASAAFFGWFDARRQGFRPVNFLGFRLDCEAHGATLHVSYMTATWKAEGLNTRLRVPPDGARHTWALSYDPQANDGGGAITFALDGGAPHVLDLLPGHRAEGAAFNRFGLFNVQIPGGPMTVYFDDVERDGRIERFDADPRWEGVGNRVSFVDREPEDTQDFGFSPTDFAGGARGEAGGTFWRTEPDVPHDAWYGDRIGPLTLDDPLCADGRVAFTRGSTDSGVYLGWFNAATRGEPPANFVGLVIEGPTRVGHYFRVAYGTAEGAAGVAETGPLIRPDGSPHRWTLSYDPSGNDGAGTLRATLDGVPVALDLAPGHKAQGATLTHFGMFTMGRGGHHMTIYFDDLRYATGRPDAARN